MLTSLSPDTVNTAGPAFTLQLNGCGFTGSSQVKWTSTSATTPLTITFVSSTLLKVVVPASLTGTAGKATVSVANIGTFHSNGRRFTTLLTTLNLLSAKLTKTGADIYTARITLKNSGHLTAPSVSITRASLGTAKTSTTLPVSPGNIARGKTGSASLSFPGSAGTSGTVVTLKVMGTFTGGAFAASRKVTLL